MTSTRNTRAASLENSKRGSMNGKTLLKTEPDETMPITTNKKEHSRQLRPNCGTHGDRTTHCVFPEEHNVDSLSVPLPSPNAVDTAAAAVAPTPEPTTPAVPLDASPTSSTGITNHASYDYTVTTKNPDSLSSSPTMVIGAAIAPTISPTQEPSSNPPTQEPSSTPPTRSPTFEPTTTAPNSVSPTALPTFKATVAAPTKAPTVGPTKNTTVNPTFYPSDNALTTSLATPIPTLIPTPHMTQDNSAANNSNAVVLTPTIATSSDFQGDGSTGMPTLPPTFMSYLETQNPTEPSEVPTGISTVTMPPATMSLLFQPDENDPSSSEAPICESNSDGNFGQTKRGTSGTSSHYLVEYFYQVVTTPKFEISRADLNFDILRRVEKAISDILVKSMFPNICGMGNGIEEEEGIILNYGGHDTTTAIAIVNEPRDDGRRLQASNTESQIVGISARSADQVLPGDLGVSCPFQLEGSDTEYSDIPSCYVVGGWLTVFTNSSSQVADDFAWIDSWVQADLEEIMNTGGLDNVDPAIAFIRYIAPGTDLTNPGGSDSSHSTNSVEMDDNTSTSAISSAPAWSWILAGFGFVGLAAAIVLMAVYRKRSRLNDTSGSDFDSSPAKDSSRGAFPAVPLEILDDNSEFDEDEIYEDDDGGGGGEQHATTKPVSWRQVPQPNTDKNDEYSRLEINVTDPNQPVVRPVLDEEAETFINNV